MSLFVDVLRSNPNAEVRVDATGSGGPYLKAFVMQDFAFGGRNSFNSAMEAILGGSISRGIAAANSAMASATGLANLAGGNMVSRTMSAGDSVSAWVASDRPKFTIPMLFLAINDGDDPRSIARDLMSFVYPSGDPNGILTAPLGYTANFSSFGNGCAAVRIGRWFQTPRLFVVKSVEMTISQRTDVNGVPLYVGAIVEFESQRTMTVDEVQAFFIGI